MMYRRTAEQIVLDFEVVGELLQLAEAVRLFELGAGGFHSMLLYFREHGTEPSIAAWTASRLARRHGFDAKRLGHLLREGVRMLETGEGSCALHLSDD